MTVMLFHDTCNGQIVLDLRNVLLSTCLPTIKSNRLILGALNMKWDTNNSVIFLCTTCNANVSVENLITYCSNCGKNYHISDLNIVSDDGEKLSGFYCEECVRKLRLNVIRKLITVIRNISLE